MLEGTPLLPSATEPLSVLLMNTIWADRAGIHDAISTRDELAAWLAVLATRLPDGAAVRRATQADLKAFRATLALGCVLYFVKDHPRREWCSAACGNRARAARHYSRHRAATR